MGISPCGGCLCPHWDAQVFHEFSLDSPIYVNWDAAAVSLPLLSIWHRFWCGSLKQHCLSSGTRTHTHLHQETVSVQLPSPNWHKWHSLHRDAWNTYTSLCRQTQPFIWGPCEICPCEWGIILVWIKITSCLYNTHNIGNVYCCYNQETCPD